MSEAEELDQRTAIACTVGIMRVALHAPWKDGETLTIHISQHCADAPPTLSVVEPPDEVICGMAEHLLMTEAGEESFLLDPPQHMHEAMLRECSRQFLAFPPGDVRTPMQALQEASLLTARNARREFKIAEKDGFAALINIHPTARVMTFQRIEFNA